MGRVREQRTLALARQELGLELKIKATQDLRSMYRMLGQDPDAAVKQLREQLRKVRADPDYRHLDPYGV